MKPQNSPQNRHAAGISGCSEMPGGCSRNPPGFLLLLYPPRSECPVNDKAVGIAPTHSRFSSPGIHARCQQHSRHTGRHRGLSGDPKGMAGMVSPTAKNTAIYTTPHGWNLATLATCIFSFCKVTSHKFLRRCYHENLFRNTEGLCQRASTGLW